MTEFGAPLKVTVDSAAVLALATVAPVVVAEELRDAVGGIFGSARRQFMAQIPHRGVKRLARRSVFYTVWPRTKKTKGGGFGLAGGERLRGPEDVLGVFHATSEAPGRHESGGTIRASGPLLPVPIGRKGENIRRAAARAAGTSTRDGFKRRGRGSIEAIKRAVGARGNSVVLLRNHAGDLVLYEREASSGSKRGRRGRGRRPKYEVKMTPLVVFKRSVNLPARLGLYHTWRSLDFDRRRRLNAGMARAVERIAKESVQTVRGGLAG